MIAFSLTTFSLNTSNAPYFSFDEAYAQLLVQTEYIWARLISLETLWQVLAIIGVAAFGYALSRAPVRKLMAMGSAGTGNILIERLYLSLARVGWPIAGAVFLWIAMNVFRGFGLQHDVMRVIASLLSAWIVVFLIASNMKTGFWSRIFAILAWTVATLYILRWLNPVMEALDSAAFEVSGMRLSALSILTSLAAVVVALWIGRVAGDAAQSQLKTSSNLTPSMAGLLGQVAKIGFMVVAVIIALYSVGINLTAFTVFTGALGVGIGFGLQAIFSNFISGIIILFEKSIKVGDFIELQSGVTGLVSEINIRSTLVRTNDNVDILVPNEEFIKSQVINWTLRESRRRLRIPFGVAYGTDKDLVRKAGLEAAGKVDWTLTGEKGREPQVWLVGFGDSSLDFELVVWLTDVAVKRPARIHADYNWEIHTALEKYDIEIPFPQRDLHLKPPANLSVAWKGAEPE